MGPDDLISLKDCHPENLVWVSGWYDAAHKRPTGWHLYQFGLPGFMWIGGPSAMPLCRAPGYDRVHHLMWKPVLGATIADFDGEPPLKQRWCHRCVVEIVERLPEIFTGRR